MEPPVGIEPTTFSLRVRSGERPRANDSRSWAVIMLGGRESLTAVQGPSGSSRGPASPVWKCGRVTARSWWPRLKPMPAMSR